MLRVLFWNVNKKDLRGLVCCAAEAELADVVILLEDLTEMSKTLTDLKSKVSPDFKCPSSVGGPRRFHVFSRDASLDLTEVYYGMRVSLRRLKFAGTELLLGMVHGVDQRNWDAQHRSHEVSLLAGEIRSQENSAGHCRTVLVGDFNMNPFDKDMNMASHMNAMMTKKCVERGSRKVQQNDYPFFYNPVWALFGDRTPGPAGTYYHSSSSQGIHGWNMLDQVLVRPDAIQWFADVQILTLECPRFLYQRL